MRATTYFLGAGASKALYPTLPVASELTLSFLLDRGGRPVGFDEAIEYVEQYVASQDWPRNLRDIPFEQVYLRFPENLAPLFPRENLEICLFRKLKIEGLGAGALPHSWLESNINAGNAVLTTNYDTVIEWDVENSSIAPPPVRCGDSGLIDYGVPAEFCLPLPSSGRRIDSRHEKLLLLKLYGSIGWSKCQQCKKYCLEKIYEAEGANAIMGRGKCYNCGGIQRSAVFVPIAGSKLPNLPGLRTIWDKAEEVLRESNHIIFAGFSLDPNDGNIGSLLKRAAAAGQTSRITVVQRQRNPEILARYTAIYGNIVEPYDFGWARYLAEITQESNWPSSGQRISA